MDFRERLSKDYQFEYLLINIIVWRSNYQASETDLILEKVIYDLTFKKCFYSLSVALALNLTTVNKQPN